MSITTTSRYGLEIGTPAITSVGSITFGPEGILFVADNSSATIFAIDVADDATAGETDTIEVEKLDSRLAAFLGCARDDVRIRDMAVHPTSGKVYLSVMRGMGAAGIPLVIRVEADGTLTEVALTGVAYSQVAIDDAPAEDDERLDFRMDEAADGIEEVEIRGRMIRLARAKLRTSTVTDMAWMDGELVVAGACNEEFASALRRIPFPFASTSSTSSLEIFHVAHGKYETASPIRTFVPYAANTSVLASYTCTPVVHFSLADLQGGVQAKGRTVAELGAGNQPLDMVSFMRDGHEFLLVSNTRHPLLEIPCEAIDTQEGLTDPQEPVGVPRSALAHAGVSHMANLNDSHVLMMQRDGSGDLHLHSYATDSLQ